jgi:peptide-methionine (R)-S-oxide reductase
MLTRHYLSMRFPSFPNIVRTLYTLSNATAHRLQQPLRGNTISQFHRATILRSMPSIPFLGALFGTSTPASAKMSFPDARSDDEWRAVLNKGT